MEIRISKCARLCHTSERPFEHGETIHSIVRIEDGTLVREDYSSENWKPEFARNTYSAWTSVYCDPRVAEEEPPEVFSPLRQVFYEAVESEDRMDLARAFLAAQLLRRQKVFRRMRESDGAGNDERLILYADRIGNRLIEVRDPNFTYAELETGRTTLMERLQQLENRDNMEETEENDQSETTTGSEDK